MKLGLVVPSLAMGGGVQAVSRFVKDTAIRSGRYELKLVSLSSASDDPCSVNLTRPSTWPRGATVTAGVWEDLPYLHVGAVGGELEFQRFKPRQVLAEVLADCHMIQVVCGSPAWANAVVGLGKPVAVQCATRARVERRLRDIRPQGLGGWWRKAMTEVTDRFDDQALRSVECIQVENPWMLDYARQLNTGRDVDLRYAPPGVDGTRFKPLAEREVTRDPYILCVARLDDPRKNVGLLLEAYARLPKARRETVRLVLAGSSGPPEAFWQRVDELGLRGRISYVPRPDLDALVALYQRASVFALPSDEEGLGIVLLEAMACGVPAVSTRCGGPDGIISDGVDGYLVPLDDAPAMADRLASLLSDPASNLEMGRRARETIDRRYDERVAGDHFIDAWDRLARIAQARG